MITQLATVKARLEIAASDLTHDDLLTRAIETISARFDRECNRTFARTVDAAEEFDADESEVLARCYPIEAVTRFEVKTTQAGGWVAQVVSDFVVRQGGVVSLTVPLVSVPEIAASNPVLARMVYTGGYVLPGTQAGPGQTALPADLESAAVEQVAAWFQQRDKVGLVRYWPKDGIFLVFNQLPLLPEVSAMIRPYRRWCI